MGLNKATYTAVGLYVCTYTGMAHRMGVTVDVVEPCGEAPWQIPLDSQVPLCSILV